MAEPVEVGDSSSAPLTDSCMHAIIICVYWRVGRLSM